MRNKTLKILLLSACLIILLAGCGGQAPAEVQTSAQPAVPAGEVSFAADVLPIFEDSCTSCHGSSRQRGGLRLDSYTALMSGGTDGAVVVPGDAANSLLVELVESGKMPRNGDPLSQAQIDLIRQWIEAGARDN